MSRHKVIAFDFGHVDGMDWEAEYEITFDYVKGSPDTYDASRGGPGGWDPGYPAEVSFVSVKPVIGTLDHGAFTDLAQKDLDEWAAEWLDENYAEAVAEVYDNSREAGRTFP